MTAVRNGAFDAFAKACVVGFSAGFLAWYVVAKFLALPLR